VNWKFRIEMKLTVEANFSGTNQIERSGTRAEAQFRQRTSQTDATRVIRRCHFFRTRAVASKSV